MEQNTNDNTEPRSSVDLFREMARDSASVGDDQLRSTLGLENPTNENAHVAIVGGRTASQSLGEDREQQRNSAAEALGEDLRPDAGKPEAPAGGQGSKRAGRRALNSRRSTAGNESTPGQSQSGIGPGGDEASAGQGRPSGSAAAGGRKTGKNIFGKGSVRGDTGGGVGNQEQQKKRVETARRHKQQEQE